MRPRRYSDKEIGKILSKAAALQSGAGDFANAEGATLAELQRVAGEVGLDPAMVERAAIEVDSARTFTTGANSNSVLLEQSVGGELSDEAWERLVTCARSFTGSRGKIDSNPQTREWFGRSEIESTLLSGTNRQGRVQLSLLGDGSGATTLTTLVGTIVGLFATLIPVIVAVKQTSPSSPWLTALLSVLLACSCAATTFWTIRARRKRFASRLGGLMDRLVDIIESSQVQTSEGGTVSLAASFPDSKTVQQDLRA